MSEIAAFFAYPARPPDIGQTICSAIADLDRYHASIRATPWEELDIPGRFIGESVLGAIDDADALIADITVLNFNVTYEIGYAIGRGKRVLLVQYRPLAHAQKELIQQVGIFDTFGYQSYENSKGLVGTLREIRDVNARVVSASLNRKTPVYLTEDRWKTDGATRIIARVKKARLAFRSFDPTEQPRLSAIEAISQVSQSFGVLVHLVSPNLEDSTVSNLRGAFIAGLAQGMGKIVLMLQQGDEPVPLDYRDLVCSYGHPPAIDEYVSEFAGRVYEAVQTPGMPQQERATSILQSFDLKSSSAENELRDLSAYYLPTEGFRRAQRGEVRLVLGRKGSGKTAIFLQVRDRLRSQRTVVLDFKPDGYRLVKFRDRVLRLLERGSAEHTIEAIWEFILYSEIVHKVLDTDREAYRTDDRLLQPYRDLAAAKRGYGYEEHGDFAERMSSLLLRIENDFSERYGADDRKSLTTSEITALVHSKDIRTLKQALVVYLKFKDAVWILFDNIDKGWSSQGVASGDLTIVKGLIEATRKIERDLQQRDVEAHTLLFLRNDIFELLVDDMPDRGKEPKALLDWTDPDLLRELLRRRAEYSGCPNADSFSALWASVCVSHIDGEESSQYLIDRCLMRPRYLIDLVSHCRGHALTVRHDKMDADDLRKGVELLSTDLISDLDYEIRDVFPAAVDVLYSFTGLPKEVSEDDVKLALMEAKLPDESHDRLVHLLLWYGFLGVIDDDGESKFIYSVNYNSKVLDTLRRRRSSQAKSFQINPAFWPALGIRDR